MPATRTGGEQKSLLLAGGDLPDVFFGDNSLGDMDILTNLDLFVPLEDYIEQYCPNIKAAYDAEPIIRKMVTQSDGHIYTLNSKLPLRPKACDIPFINQKWLDNLNLEIPTTVDEWYNVLKAFKEQDANGNGDPNDEVPLSGSGKGDMFHWIRYINPWGITDSLETNYLALDQETGEPIFIPADERYKECVQFFEKLYAEGIMDQEYFTQDGSQSDAKMKNEEVSLVGTGIAWEVSSATNPHSDEYVPMPPLAGPRGDRYVRGNDGLIIYRRNNFTVTTACEQPEVAMRWADYYSSDDISVQSYWGPFGEALEKADDGTITFLDPPEGKTGDVWYWEITCRDYGPKYVSPETEAKIQLPENSGDGAKLECDEDFKEFVAQPYPVVNYTPEQMDEISKVTVDIYKYVQECWANMVCFSYRFKAVARYMKHILEKGYIGKIYHVYMQYLQAGGGPEWDLPRSWRYIKELTGTGALGDLGCHALDLVSFVTGKDYVKAVGHADTFTKMRRLEEGEGLGPVDVDDFCNYLMEMEEGIAADFEITRFAYGRGNYQRLEIYGSKGAVVYTLDAKAPGVDELEVCIGPVTGYAGVFTTLPIPERFRVDQMQSFADILNGASDGMAATIKEGRHIQHALESIIRSAEEQKWLQVSR